MRKTAEVQAAEQEYFDRLWYYRSTSCPRDEDVQAAERKIQERYGVDSLVAGSPHDSPNRYEAYDLGRIEGKLSALRWVLGDEWDNLDT
jgi:hypothetical protein